MWGGEGERGSAGTESLSERLVYFMFFLHQGGSPGGSPPDIFLKFEILDCRRSHLTTFYNVNWTTFG